MSFNNPTFQQAPLNKQRKDKFILVLSLPEALKQVNKKIDRTSTYLNFDSLTMSVYGVLVPRIQINEIKAGYSGQTLHVSSLTRVPFPSVTVNFTIDNRFNNYWVINKWLDLLNDQATGITDQDQLSRSTTSELYKATFSLFGLDEYNNKVIEFTFTKAFPVTLGDIDYNYRNPDQIDTFFEFSFDQMYTKLLEPTLATKT
jgi:hypothetical protein